MYDKELALEVLVQIEAALRTIAERFKPVKTVSDFTGSPAGMEKLDSICMLLIVIGETLKKLDKITDTSLLAKYPQIDWKKVKGLRDVISHQYFDVNAEWKDITVVYCLLNQNDSSHYVKVNKAFLGEQDAYIMAQISDSFNYENINVSLERWKNDNLLQTIILDTTYINKESGIFATDNNIIYKTSDSICADSEYKLIIDIPGKEPVTSTTKLIDGFRVLNNFEAPQRVIGFSSSSPETIEWYSVENARLYELTIRFHYYEITGTGTVAKSIDWKQPAKLSPTIFGNDKMSLEIPGESFYQFIAANISVDESVERRVRSVLYGNTTGCMDFMFMLGGDDLNTYIEVSRPSNTIVQEKPAFTNIVNGVGIFSCRYDKNIFGKELSDRSIDSLSCGQYTRDLRFVKSNGKLCWDD